MIIFAENYLLQNNLEMIKSILDNDLYKFSMCHYYQMMYPEAIGTFTFNDRNNTVYNDMFLVTLKNAFMELDNLALTEKECEWAIKNIPYIPRHYWEWLKSFRFDHNKIRAWLDEDKHLHIEVTDVIYKASMYEMPILATVSEVYYKFYAIGLGDFNYQVLTPLKKNCQIAMDNNYTFIEFGMRRRYSYAVEDAVVKYLSENCPNCVGTSNVHLAMKHGMKPCFWGMKIKDAAVLSCRSCRNLLSVFAPSINP
jgi:nicotinate phosphoribosyltransferase